MINVSYVDPESWNWDCTTRFSCILEWKCETNEQAIIHMMPTTRRSNDRLSLVCKLSISSC